MLKTSLPISFPVFMLNFSVADQKKDEKNLFYNIWMSSLTGLLVQCSICMELSGGSIWSIHDKLFTEFLTPHIVLMNNLHLLLAKTFQNLCCEGESPVFLPSQYLPCLRSVSRRKTELYQRKGVSFCLSVEKKFPPRRISDKPEVCTTFRVF